MADPLSLLRQFNIDKKTIVEKDDQIIFGDFSWPKKVQTKYLKYGSNKEGALPEYYTLESILYLLNNVSLRHSVYVVQCAKEGIPAVSRPDRKDLLAYLNGETRTCSSIKMALPTQVKRPAKDDAIGGDTMAKKPLFEKAHVEKVIEQLTARLDANKKETAVNIDDLKSLSETMTVEKIAAIKAKRLANKRTTIKRTDADDAMSTEFHAMLDFDVDSTKDIISHEIVHRTRNTILQSTGKTFRKDVFAILERVKAREDAVERLNKLPAQLIPYDRYDQERFKRPKQETEGFKIDTMGTYQGMTLKSVTEGSNTAQQRKPNMLSAPQQIPRGPKELMSVYQMSSAQKRPSRTPIIIIPALDTSLITMYNAKDILEDLKYVSTAEKKQQGCMRDNEVLLQRKRNNATVPYRVIDNPQKLSASDWQRVVAVFVLGPAWQFKKWPWNSNPVEIFSNICGFHLRFSQQPLHANVAKWSVTLLNLPQNQRHLDCAVMMKFWETLDEYMIMYKPELRF